MQHQRLVSEQAAKYWDAAQPDPRRPQKAAGHIHIRIPGALRRKAAYVRAADGRPLADWVAETLDRAAGYQED